MNVERLDAYDFGASRARLGSKWDPYLGGDIYRIVAKEAGFETVNSMRSTLYTIAARRNKRLESRVENDDTLVFRAHDKAQT